MKFLKDHAYKIIIVILVVVLFLQRCTEKATTNPSSPIITIRDTTIYVHDTIFSSVPVFIKSEKPKKTETKKSSTTEEGSIWIPITDTTGLQACNDLYEAYSVINTFTDTARFDSSRIIVTSTVSGNELISNQYEIDLKYPTVTVNNYIPTKLRTQLYVGGQISGSKENFLNSVSANFLIKNKKDQIFGGGIGTNFNYIVYNIQSYWKIRLKK